MSIFKQMFEKWFCKHKWEIHHTTNIYDTYKDKWPHAQRQTLICKECGEIKQIKL